MKMKLTLRTADDNRQQERTAMQETVRRAMNTVVTQRLIKRKPLCRDAVHSV